MFMKFNPAVLKAIGAARSLAVRSGDEHRHTNVWVVVVDGRVLARSWFDKPGGWFRAFLKQPIGAIRVKTKEWPARGLRVRSVRLCNAMSAALAKKYPHKGSQHYVDGFRTSKRKATTMEFLPA